MAEEQNNRQPQSGAQPAGKNSGTNPDKEDAREQDQRDNREYENTGFQRGEKGAPKTEGSHADSYNASQTNSNKKPGHE